MPAEVRSSVALFRRKAKTIGSPVAQNALGDLRDLIDGWIAAGFDTYDTVERNAVELGEDDGIQPAAARTLVRERWLAAVDAQQTWPDTRDSDALEAAFADLEARGVAARMNFSCCGTCAPGELIDEVGLGGSKHGYVYFHQQDAEAIFEGSLFLGYGSLRDFDREAPGASDAYVADAVSVGHEVVDALRSHNLSVTWDGSLDRRIRVTDLEWRRRIPDAP